MELIEAVVGKLVDAGFDHDNAMLAYNAFSYTRGATSSTTASAPVEHAHPGPAATAHDRLVLHAGPGESLDRHPLAGTTDEDFAFSAARLLCGFEVLLAEQGEPA